MNCALGLNVEEDDKEADALATVISAVENIQTRLHAQVRFTLIPDKYLRLDIPERDNHCFLCRRGIT